jgi:hypothetical protein
VEHSGSAWIAADVLDENRRAAPQHLGFAQSRTELMGPRTVSVSRIDALGDQRASLQAEDRSAPESGALAERAGGAGEENLNGGRSAQPAERLAYSRQPLVKGNQRVLGSPVAVLGLAPWSVVAWVANTAPVAAPIA